MEREWFSAEEIVAARSDELPASIRSFNRHAHGWRSNPDKTRKAGGRGRPRWEYHISLLPHSAQMRLALMHTTPSDAAAKTEDQSTGVWRRYEALSKSAKDQCARRLDALEKVESYRQSGLSETAAI